MDYQRLKAADAALGIDDPAAAAASLNGRGSFVTVDVSARNAREVLLGTGQYGALVLASEATLGADATDQQKQLKALCIECVAVLDKAETIAFSDPIKAAQITAALGMLVAAGLITQNSADAIVAQSSRWVPQWDPPVTDADVVSARSL